MKRTIAAALAALAFSFPLPAQDAAFEAQLEKVEPIVGTWTYRPITGGSEAAFADSSGAQRLVLRCSRTAGTVSIILTNVPAAAPYLVVTTTFAQRSLPARYFSTKTLTADVAATDPLLDAMAFSRGKFAISNAGSGMLVVPAWADPGRVIEDCRN